MFYNISYHLHVCFVCFVLLPDTSLRKKPTSPQNDNITEVQRLLKIHTMMHHYPDLGSISDWLKICFIQSEALPRSR